MHEVDLDPRDFEQNLDWDFYGRIGQGGCLDGKQRAHECFECANIGGATEKQSKPRVLE